MALLASIAHIVLVARVAAILGLRFIPGSLEKTAKKPSCNVSRMPS
jgi:hypothetical protein